MNNLGQTIIGNDEGASIYLSFDAESTINSAAFKTLDADSTAEATNETSMMDSVELNTNSTLEDMDDKNLQVQTVKRMSQIGFSPLRPFQVRNVMNEFKTNCSTPSKNHDIPKLFSSEAQHNLHITNSLRDTDNIESIISIESVENENKENSRPNILATFSETLKYSEMTIEQKMLSMAISDNSLVNFDKIRFQADASVLSDMEKTPTIEITSEKKIFDDSVIIADAKLSHLPPPPNCQNNVMSNNSVKMEVPQNNVDEKEADDLEVVDDAKKSHVSPSPNYQNYVTSNNSAKKEMSQNKLIENEIKQPQLKQLDDIVIVENPKMSYVPRLSNYHNNFKSNNSAKMVVPQIKLNEKDFEPHQQEQWHDLTAEDVKFSHIPISSNYQNNVKSNNSAKVGLPQNMVNEKEIKQLQPKHLEDLIIIKDSKISHVPQTSNFQNNVVSKNSAKMGVSQIKINEKEIKSLQPEQSKINDKRKSVFCATSKARRSMLPLSFVDKRTHTGQRMSIIVKTTLNSPARKMARKSIQPQQHRKTILPPKETIASKGVNLVRKSMMPSSKLRSQPDRATNVDNLQAGKAQPRMSSTASGGANSLPTTFKRKTDNITGFSCVICGSKFRIKSLLDAHKRSHEIDSEPNVALNRKSSATFANGSNVPLLQRDANQCKYCDKKFALTRALHIHLMQNCIKIPPTEKRKLHYGELDHEKKAQLPHFSQCHNANTLKQPEPIRFASSTSILKKSLFGDIKQEQNQIRQSVFQTTELNVVNEITELVDGIESQMLPPTTKNIRKKTAHSGVYRTPTKSVPCHICKQSFKSILDYTNHSLSMHSKN